MQDHEPIGVIGLGLLGGAIARRLDAAGYRVLGFDPRSPADLPVTLCASAGEVFLGCSKIIFSVPDSAVAAGVIAECGEQVHGGHTVIDTTTGEPGEVIAIGETLAARGADYVEANVAGSSALLREGGAVLFVAGEEQVTDGLRPLLATLSNKPPLYLGSVGRASKFKLVHNLVLGLQRAVLAEGLQFAEAMGFSADETLALLQQTTADCGVMATKGRRMAERRYEPPQALVSQHLKDVRLILAQAAQLGARTPLSELHRQLLESVEARGLGDADNSAIIEAFNPE